MKILEKMTITEAADVIYNVAMKLKDEKGITEQEAYNIIFQDKDRYLGGIDDDNFRG